MFKNFISQSLHTFATKGLSLITTFSAGVITARVLHPEGKGGLALLASVGIMLQPLFELGIRQSNAYFLGKKSYQENLIYSSMQYLMVLVSVSSIVLVSSIFYIYGFFKTYGLVVPSLFVLSLPITLYISFNTGVLIAKKKIELINISGLIQKISYLVCLIVLLYVLKKDLFGAALSAILSQCISACFIVYWLVKLGVRFKPQFNRDIVLALVKKGSIYAIALFMIYLNYRVDYLMLGSMKGDSSVGVYSVGVSICEIIKEIPLAIGLVLFSRSANWKKNEIVQSVEKTLLLSRVIFFLITISTILLNIIAKYVIPLVYGVEFSSAVQVIQFLSLGIIMISVFLILNFFVAGQGRPEISIYVFIPGLLINVVLNYFLIQKYDYIGAAISSSLSYTFSVLAYAIIFTKVYKVRLTDIFLITFNDLRFILGTKKV